VKDVLFFDGVFYKHLVNGKAPPPWHERAISSSSLFTSYR